MRRGLTYAFKFFIYFFFYNFSLFVIFFVTAIEGLKMGGIIFVFNIMDAIML